MQVSVNHKGAIIGKAGATVISIQTETGAKVNVGRESEAPHVNVSVSGSPEAVAKAVARIQAIIADISSRHHKHTH
jgi:polyribonucleotide nucleotidyltransferase